MQSACAFNKAIEGNGNVITKNFPISDYDKIEIEGNMEFDYTQSNTTPTLEITLDENLFDYLDIYVKKSTLRIVRKKGIDNLSIHPTTYKIITNSSTLQKLDKAGSGTFNFVSPLKTNVLAIHSTGSGKVICKNEMNVGNLHINTTGSGSIVLRGEVDRANINLAGSGHVGTHECRVNSLDCNIAGSGKIEVWVVNHLSCNIAGSGDLIYKGDPQISDHNTISGSGRVKRK
jgi:hypothetical protein